MRVGVGANGQARPMPAKQAEDRAKLYRLAPVAMDG